MLIDARERTFLIIAVNGDFQQACLRWRRSSANLRPERSVPRFRYSGHCCIQKCGLESDTLDTLETIHLRQLINRFDQQTALINFFWESFSSCSQRTTKIKKFQSFGFGFLFVVSGSQRITPKEAVSVVILILEISQQPKSSRSFSRNFFFDKCPSTKSLALYPKLVNSRTSELFNLKTLRPKLWSSKALCVTSSIRLLSLLLSSIRPHKTIFKPNGALLAISPSLFLLGSYFKVAFQLSRVTVRRFSKFFII